MKSPSFRLAAKVYKRARDLGTNYINIISTKAQRAVRRDLAKRSCELQQCIKYGQIDLKPPFEGGSAYLKAERFLKEILWKRKKGKRKIEK